MFFLKITKTLGGRPLGLLLPLLAMAASGCSDLTRAGNPVIKTGLTEDVVTLSTKAERRLVFASTSDDPNLRICAEPSPDVAEAVSAAVRAGVEASGSADTVTDAKVRAEIAQSVATEVAPIFKRSQGLQYLRDGTYAICQGALGGVANGDPELIIDVYKQLLVNSKELIMAEIEDPSWNADLDIQVTAPTLSDLKPVTVAN